ncbi:MAG: hypothetical protein HQ582_31505 [Planctomycetes bacterium]|nr:hypothetical protein [Planctomycetota bacterium]
MFRNKIEQAAVEANHGPLSVYQQASVQTAARYEMVALLATRWLRVGDDKLTPDQRLTHATTIAKSSELRDKALQRAGLDRKGRQQALDALYGEVEDEADESHAEGHDTDKGTQSDGNSPEPSAGIPAENGE